jgi:hypothetical protein
MWGCGGGARNHSKELGAEQKVWVMNRREEVERKDSFRGSEHYTVRTIQFLLCRISCCFISLVPITHSVESG